MRGRSCSPSWSCSASRGCRGAFAFAFAFDLYMRAQLHGPTDANDNQQLHSRASASPETAGNGSHQPPDAASSLQLELLERKHLDALAARDEADLERLRQLPPSSSDETMALMDAARLPTWLARLEEEMLGLGGSKETEWGVLAPDAKRRRVARFDSLSDAAIYRQRLQEDDEAAAAEADGASSGGRGKGRKKPAGGGASRMPSPLAPAPSDAECVKCLVEGRLDEKLQGTTEDEEQALVLCSGCANPYHRGCLGAGDKRCCAFCEAEE